MPFSRERRPFSESEYSQLVGAGIVEEGARLEGGALLDAQEGRRHRFSVDDYERMLEVGVFYSGEPCELLAGEIWEAAGIGNRHLACVSRLDHLLKAHLLERAIVNVQSPLILTDDTEPEPDLTVLAWRDDFYESAKPRAEDALLVIEVADTSYAFDRRIKLPLYASSGVIELWIVDVVRRSVEVHLDPARGRYRSVARHGSGAVVSPRLLPDLRLEVDAIVPPTTGTGSPSI